MSMVAMVAILLVIGVQLYGAKIELFDWNADTLKKFPIINDLVKTAKPELIPETAVAITKPIVLNMGLYNLFLAAGLLLSLTALAAPNQAGIAGFLCLCVAIAGVFGVLTTGNTILYAQTATGLLALAVLYFWPVSLS